MPFVSKLIILVSSLVGVLLIAALAPSTTPWFLAFIILTLAFLLSLFDIWDYLFGPED